MLTLFAACFANRELGAGRETNTSAPGDILTVQIPEVVEVDFDSSSYPPPYVTTDSSPQLVTSSSSPFPTTPPTTTEIVTSTTGIQAIVIKNVLVVSVFSDTCKCIVTSMVTHNYPCTPPYTYTYVHSHVI